MTLGRCTYPSNDITESKHIYNTYRSLSKKAKPVQPNFVAAAR